MSGQAEQLQEAMTFFKVTTESDLGNKKTTVAALSRKARTVTTAKKLSSAHLAGRAVAEDEFIKF
jgi:hypothetical protein